MVDSEVATTDTDSFSGEEKGPRVRIAPSPTGDPHVGTAYIALFNYVFARKHGGQFILRIEDTDQQRSSLGSEKAILSALKWIGLNWDEGPDLGGPHGPYRQSERLEIYQEHVQQLLDSGHAYYCFCTKERLDEVRERQRQRKLNVGYDGYCRDLPYRESRQKADSGQHCVIRLKVPKNGRTVFIDGLRGKLEFENELIDDQVILKSDGFPTYHLANVIDDHLMKVTHVIRGEEWITSTPKHILLYQAFGWEIPEFYHLGLLRNTDKSKLSKRKNPVSIFYYRDMGFLPQTFVNFLGTMGFSIGGDRERFSLEEMIEHFSWSKVSPGGPVFDPIKLEAFNGDDIREMRLESLYQEIMTHVFPKERLMAILEQSQPRINRLDDFIPYAGFFFGETLDFEPVRRLFYIKNRSKAEVIGVLEAYLEGVEIDENARSFGSEGLEVFSRTFCKSSGWKTKELFSLLRISTTARTAAPPLFVTMALCGKDRVRARIRSAINFLKNLSE